VRLTVVAKALGGELIRHKKLGGLGNEGFRLEVRAEDRVKKFAVKLYQGRNARLKAEKELSLYKLMPRYGLRAPRIVLVDLDGELAGKPLLAWEWIEGVTAENMLERKRSGMVAARALGAALAKLHSIPLRELNPKLFGRGESFWEGEAEALRLLARLAGPRGRAISDLADTVEELEVESPSLVHGDYNPGNVLMARDGVYILDFEDARVGDPVFDVAYAYAFMSAGRKWELAKAFVLEYFRLSGLRARCFSSRLMAAAAKLYLFLNLKEVISVFKRKMGVLYPLADLVFLRPFKKHLEMLAGGRLARLRH